MPFEFANDIGSRSSGVEYGVPASRYNRATYGFYTSLNMQHAADVDNRQHFCHSNRATPAKFERTHMTTNQQTTL
jgi:hypothetical protein